MKMDWNKFWYFEICGFAITLLWYVCDPKHQWEPRAIAVGLQTLIALAIASYPSKENQ